MQPEVSCCLQKKYLFLLVNNDQFCKEKKKNICFLLWITTSGLKKKKHSEKYFLNNSISNFNFSFGGGRHSSPNTTWNDLSNRICPKLFSELFQMYSTPEKFFRTISHTNPEIFDFLLTKGILTLLEHISELVVKTCQKIISPDLLSV